MNASWNDSRTMKGGARALLVGLAITLFPAAPGTHAQESITAAIDVTSTGAPIGPLLYGYFIENLGSMFESGLWAEMLGDRKFFHAVNNDSVLRPPNSRSRFVGRWYPLGPERRVTMDSAHAWVGKHSPRVALEAGDAAGIRQPALSLRQGRRYVGRVVLAADPGASVQVSLVWGDRPGERQTATIPSPTTAYARYPLEFTARGTTLDGRLEITGTGSGSLWIGAVSLMPADNIEGFRRELIELLREVRPTMLRWGGNFSAGYEWRDGIGNPDKRPPRYDYAWNAVEQNDVGTFEVLALNRLLGAEPNIGVNAGLGDAYSAAQWVEYVNGSRDTPMGRLRAEHGHPDPFGVKWWGIGNEMYGQWQLGHMSIDHFVIQHNRFAEAMRAVDPSIILVASGATPFETGTTARHHRKPLPSRLPYEYDSPEDWSGRLLRGAWRNIDYVAEHIYAVPNQAFDVGLQAFAPIEDPVQDQLRRIPNRVRAAVEAWEEYRQRMPWLADSGIRLVLDEWSSGGRGGGDMAGAMGAALTLHEVFRRTDVWAMSAYTGLTSLVAYDRTDAAPAMRATGFLFKLYRDHLGSLPVQVSGSPPQPELRGTVGVDKPRISSGSPTYPLDVLAALSSDRATLTVAVVNPSESAHTLRLRVDGATPRSGRSWTLAAREPGARSVPGEPSACTVIESREANAAAPLTIAPATIQLYEFPLR